MITINFNYFVKRGELLEEGRRSQFLKGGDGDNKSATSAMEHALNVVKLAGLSSSKSRMDEIRHYCYPLISDILTPQQAEVYNLNKGHLDSIWEPLIRGLINSGRLDAKELIDHLTNDFEFIKFLIVRKRLPSDINSLKKILANSPTIDKHVIPKLEEYLHEPENSDDSHDSDVDFTPEERSKFISDYSDPSGPTGLPVKISNEDPEIAKKRERLDLIKQINKRQTFNPLLKIGNAASKSPLAQKYTTLVPTKTHDEIKSTKAPEYVLKGRRSGKSAEFRNVTGMSLDDFLRLQGTISTRIRAINNAIRNRNISYAKSKSSINSKFYVKPTDDREDSDGSGDISNPYSGFLSIIADTIDYVKSTRDMYKEKIGNNPVKRENFINDHESKSPNLVNMVMTDDDQFNRQVSGVMTLYKINSNSPNNSDVEISPERFYADMNQLKSTALEKGKVKRAAFFQALITQMESFENEPDIDDYIISNTNPFVKIDPAIIKEFLGGPDDPRYKTFKTWYDANAKWKSRLTEKHMERLEKIMMSDAMDMYLIRKGVTPTEKAPYNPFTRRIRTLVFKIDEGIRDLESERDPELETSNDLDYRQNIIDKIHYMQERLKYLVSLDEEWKSQHPEASQPNSQEEEPPSVDDVDDDEFDDETPMGESVLIYMTEQVKSDQKFSGRVTKPVNNYKSFKNYNHWLTYNT